MTALTSPVFTIQRSNERAYFDHGWLQTYHSFSFAEYTDPDNQNWGALRVFNDDTIAGGTGFPVHPHRDMEIITYVLSGELAHEDSMGNRGVVAPGGVQFMSAGTGVRHSEFNHNADRPLHFSQMWVLPGSLGTPPSYGQIEAPARELNRWLTLVSGEGNVEAPIRITQQATFKVVRLENGAVVHEFAPKRYGFLFVASGRAEVNGDRMDAGDSIRSYDVGRLSVKGTAEALLWDLPAVA